jgi:hypothetical protein
MKAGINAICLSAVAVLLLVPPLAAAKPAPSARSGSKALVLSSFELEGSNGYTIEAGAFREGSFPATVAVAAHRGQLRASYAISGVLEPGIHAIFGSLGQVAVDFHRKTRSVERPEKGCTYVTETGVFSGEFRFMGEGGYTSAEATSAPGEVVRLHNGFCGFGRRGRPGIFSSTILVARSRIPHGFLEFEASSLDLAPSFEFRARTQESLGSMTITRSGSAKAMKGDVKIGPGKRPRRIDVNPPAPFAGSARFRDPTGGPPTWEGSLSVSLPGAPTVATPLAGPGFGARLCLRISLLAACKVALPPRTTP